MLRKILIFCATLGLVLTAIAETPTSPITVNKVEKATVIKAKHHTAKPEINFNTATASDLVKAGLTQEQAEKIITNRPTDGFKHLKEINKGMNKDDKKTLKDLKKHYKFVITTK